MPSREETRSVRVEEGYGGREIVVVIDEVGQVRHGLVALIDGGGEPVGVRCDISRIDYIDGSLPTAKTSQRWHP